MSDRKYNNRKGRSDINDITFKNLLTDSKEMLGSSGITDISTYFFKLFRFFNFYIKP